MLHTFTCFMLENIYFITIQDLTKILDHQFKKRTDILTDGAKLLFSDGIKLKNDV